MALKPLYRFFAFLLVAVYSGPAFAAQAGEGASNFEVTLLVDGKRVADTWINLSANGTHIEVPAAPILSALASILDKEAIATIEKQVSNQGMLTNRVLSRYGVLLSINGPKRQVFLSLAKKKPASEPVAVGSPAKPAAEVPPVSSHSEVKDDSGPWASPPVPALPGKVADSLDTVFTIGKGQRERVSRGVPAASARAAPNPGFDEGWAPSQDSASAEARSSKPPARDGPTVQLQSYRMDKTRDELFEEVFKRKAPPLPASVEVTLLVDGKSYGTLWLQYNKEQKRYTFPVEPVLNALQGLVRADLFEKLSQRARTRSRFTVEDLIESGFPTMLNTSVFELSTGVPAQLMGTKIHNLTQLSVDPNTVPAIEQGRLSGYLNAKVKSSYSYYQFNPTPFDSNGVGFRTVQSQNENPREPVVTTFEGAVNLLGWVAEGRANLWEKIEDNSFEASRDDFRIVHDWPKKAVRLTAGDLIFPTSGFQSFLKMGGIGLSRDFSLQPHMSAYPVKEFEFFLSNPSEVKIYINGVLRATFQEMVAGPHDLRGFPFTQGESEVDVQIRENTGQTQTLHFSFIHEPSLLAKGLSAFSYNIGLPSVNTYNRGSGTYTPTQPVVLNYEYDTEHPALFLDYKLGVTNQMTLEAYTQALDTGGMVGFIGLYALKIGKVSAGFAASYQGEGVIDGAGNLEYTYIPKLVYNQSPISWRLRAEYIGRDFFRPGQDPGLFGSFTLGSSIQKNSGFANLNLGMSYTVRPDSTDFYDLIAGMNRSWKYGLSGNLTFKNTFDRQRHTNTSVSLTMTYYLFADQQSVRASHRIENHRPEAGDPATQSDWDNTSDLSWDYNGSAPFPKNPILNATGSFGPVANDYTSGVEYKGNQGGAQLLARRNEPKKFSVISNHFDLSLQSSLVFVGGTFGLSRPITNSFVLVKGIENEKECDILVNPSEVGYDAKGVEWLPAVVPNMNSYYLKKIHVDVLDPPFGSGEERTDFTLYPGYKSGYAIFMGTNATVIALGTLLLGAGVPAQYQTFTATPLDAKSSDPIMGFTNGAGKFQLTRMQPGRYRIEMTADGKEYSLILTLPKKSSGIKSVGTLLLKPK